MRTLLVASLFLAAGAHAAPVAYSFSGVADSGALTGEAYAGGFSIDPAALAGVGDEYLAVSGFGFSFLGASYSAADFAPAAHFADGVFVGLDGFADLGGVESLALISGFSDPADAYFAYDLAAGAGFGPLAYQIAAVPEPQTFALLAVGLGLVAAFTRRRTLAHPGA